MDRRGLLKGAVAAGTRAGARTGLFAEPVEAASPPDRPIVVEGLSAGSIRLSDLKGMQQGGVDGCVASGAGDMESFAALLRFFDEHRSELVLAKSVAEIRQARRDGRVSNVFGVQSAEALGSGFNSALGSAATPPRAFFEIGLWMVEIAYN